MRAYSMDLRERALLDSDAGMKAADVAAKYRVSGSWVRLLKQRRRETGEVAPRVQRHGRRCMLEPHLHTLAALIAAHPDRTLAELQDALATPASVPTVWRAVPALGLTVKKTVRPSEHDRPDVAAARVAWHAAAPTWMSPTSCVWTKPASPPICFGGTAGHHVARASTTTPLRALADQHVSRRVAGHGADRTGGLRRRDRWRELPRLHRPDPGADPAARRHRHRRQPRGPQGRRHPAGPPGRRGHPLVLATLQPGPQSHRALLREAQGPRSHRSLSPHRDALAVPRRVLGALQPDECRNYVRHCGYSAATRS